MKISLFIMLFLFSIKIYGQEERQLMNGKVFNDSLLVDNIHVINLNTNYGTISDHKGVFNIPVQLHDTLQLSGIQFYTKILIVTNAILENEITIVQLHQKTNELEEVEVKTNPFSGNLATDIDKVKLKSNISDGVLVFSNIDFKHNIFDSNSKGGKPPDASKLTNPHIPIGLTLIKADLGKPFKKKKPPVQIIIRQAFGDDFFIKTLNIPLLHIDPFLNHCKSKEITKLYELDKKLAFTDALIKESKIYLKNISEEQ